MLVLFKIYVNTEEVTNYSTYVVILQKQQSYELALIKLKIKCDNFLTRTIYDKKYESAISKFSFLSTSTCKSFYALSLI